MNLRIAGSAAGILGGLCWVLRWLLDDPAWGGWLRLAGLTLLGLALAAVGAGLVSRSATWLRVIVAVAFPLLAWSVYTVVRGGDDDVTLDGVLGVVALVTFALALLRRRPRRPEVDHGRSGSHAAR